MSSRYFIAWLLISTLPVLAADPWTGKDPATWTDKEVRQVLNKSPWAKEASANFNPERMGGMGGPGMGRGRGGGMGEGGPGGGPGMGGPGGGPGMGGPGMGPDGQEMSPPKMTILWVSASPVQEAIAKGGSGLDPKAVADWSKEFYVVAVSGMRMGPRGGGRRRGGENSGDRKQPDPERMKEFRERMQERMKQATVLRLAGKDTIAPARIEMVEGDQGRITVFLFPRSREISADDKEVSFETAMGPMEITTKFVLKDMKYRGKLAM